MTDRPIIFSAPMVQAILAGRKSMTRRVLKPQPPAGLLPEGIAIAGEAQPTGCGYRLGDRLWVREAFTCEGQSEGEALYRATVDEDTGYYAEEIAEIRWRPSIHMPRWASRLTLTVTDVHVQRLQEISEADALAEGCPAQTAEELAGMEARGWFRDLWDSLNAHRAPWATNPWVVALTFTVHLGNIDQVAA